jgi:hypothetical protein
MKTHDRFESLAGAVALGEATDNERAEFAAHAGRCALCRHDALDAAASPLAALAAAREEEVWRPTLDRAILARIRDRHSARSRITVGALGWAAGLSIAANVFFVSGFAGQLSRALTPPDVPPQITAGIRLPAQTFAKPPVARVTTVRVALAPARAAQRTARAPRGPLAHPHGSLVHREPAPVLAPPDVFADLYDTHDAGGERKVAIETSFAHTEVLQP